MSEIPCGGFSVGEPVTVQEGVFRGLGGPLLGALENGLMRVEITFFGRVIPFNFEAHLLRAAALDEEGYLTCHHPHRLVSHLARRTRQPARKIVLFGVACARLSWERLDSTFREGIELAERWAEDPPKSKVRKAARQKITGPHPPWQPFGIEEQAVPRTAHQVAALLAGSQESWSAWPLVYPTTTPDATLAELCREVFGNPFRPAWIDSEWLAWDRGVVFQLARAIHDERRFDEMPVLADALEDAGCTDEVYLRHCRSPNHTRGCWLLDALLGETLPDDARRVR